MLTLFLGTLLITALCCGLMLLAVNASGKSLPGGCGKSLPDALRCEECPRRRDGKCPPKEVSP